MILIGNVEMVLCCIIVNSQPIAGFYLLLFLSFSLVSSLSVMDLLMSEI